MCGVVIGDAEVLLSGIGQERLPFGIDGLELGEILHEDPEGASIAAHTSGMASSTAAMRPSWANSSSMKTTGCTGRVFAARDGRQR